MSQNYCLISFALKDHESQLSDLVETVKKIYSEIGEDIFNISFGKSDKKKRKTFIEFDGQDVFKGLHKSLVAISNVSTITPIASIYWDQAGSYGYACLVDGKLSEFADMQSLKAFLKRDTSNAPELKFLELSAGKDLVMLARLRFKKKKLDKLKNLSEVAQQYISTQSDDDFEQLLEYITQQSDYEEAGYLSADGDYDVEHSEVIAIAKALCFVGIEDNDLYIGYATQALKNSADQCHWGWNAAMEVTIPLSSMQGTKDVQAKVFSLQKNLKTEWFIYEVPEADYMCLEQRRDPVTVWF